MIFLKYEKSLKIVKNRKKIIIFFLHFGTYMLVEFRKRSRIHKKGGFLGFSKI
jgi:hypothetical protein